MVYEGELATEKPRGAQNHGQIRVCEGRFSSLRGCLPGQLPVMGSVQSFQVKE